MAACRKPGGCACITNEDAGTCSWQQERRQGHPWHGLTAHPNRRAVDNKAVPSSTPHQRWAIAPPGGYSNHTFPPQTDFPSYEAAAAFAQSKGYPPRTRIVCQDGLPAPTPRWGPPRPSADLPSAVEDLAPTATAQSICETAAALVGDPRAVLHGDKSINFANIAALWNGYLEARARAQRAALPLSALDVGNMLELFKVARRLSGVHNIDDYIDAAGYAGCTGEIACAQEATNAKP